MTTNEELKRAYTAAEVFARRRYQKESIWLVEHFRRDRILFAHGQLDAWEEAELHANESIDQVVVRSLDERYTFSVDAACAIAHWLERGCKSAECTAPN